MGSDHAGLELKQALRPVAEELGFEVKDVGTHDTASCDYPDFAHAVARGVAAGDYRFGVLVCGTGLGMSYAANRHRDIRAALCTETFAARMSREHNDANVLCMGARVIGAGVAGDVLRAFLTSEFEGGRHARRVAKIELHSEHRDEA
ncbi:MAG: ribose 5-phosphate isomerase B [Myxococcales bacterium]